MRNSRFHRGSNADRAVNPAEIIIRKVQRKRSQMVFQFLAEAICQSSESANLHTHREVLTFNVRRAYLCRIGLADNWDHLR